MALTSVREFARSEGLEIDDTLDCHAPAGAQEGDGSLWIEEGRLLSAWARKAGVDALEIGAQRGISARYILAGLDPEAVLTSIDLNHQWKRPRVQNLVQVTGSSFTYRDPTLYVGWAFVDGDHTADGVLRDITTARVHGATTLFFHDGAEQLQGVMHDGAPIGVRQAILDWHRFREDTWELVELDTPSGLFFARKYA